MITEIMESSSSVFSSRSSLAITFFGTTAKPKPFLITLNPSTSKGWRKIKSNTRTISLSSLSSFNLHPLHNDPIKVDDQEQETLDETTMLLSDLQNMDPAFHEQLLYEALIWSSLHGLVVGDKKIQRSGRVPGVGMVHSPFSLLPKPFPQFHWQQACQLAPLFNELVDRVSLDGEFLQESLSRTKEVDVFTGRLLDIHSKMLKNNKREEIRLGLHRSDYMLDSQTNSLLQVELNTISTSSIAPGCIVSDLHRNLLDQHGKLLGLDSGRIPRNSAVRRYAEALAKAWNEYNNPRAVVLVVVQTDEHNMYDQHWLLYILKEIYPF
ncbi:hypothetical protein NE237_015637 [Protea cynaroides]|uniref:Glutathione synthase n=1 Tax=Protea cynaroides TaxID=273540 RepID=A0A9Q0KEB6_9MAGN|nr:hypothetical protein NE237_015637 [Protea cynaroides]